VARPHLREDLDTMGWRSWLVACVSDGDIGDVLMAGIAFHFDVRTVRILDELWKCFFSHSGSIEMCELYWVESKKDRGLHHRTLFHTRAFVDCASMGLVIRDSQKWCAGR
jgi:hypothetical protein